MEMPFQVSFKNLDRSPVLEAKVRERVDELERFFGRIVSCRVVVEADSHRPRQGRLYRVRADLRVPGKEIVVNHGSPEHHAHEDVYVAVRDCFDAVRRQLEDHVRRRRSDVKHHEEPGHGRIARLLPKERYGTITASDGREIYFHPNAVAGSGFERLSVGDEVRFEEHPGEGEKGPQASTVTPVGKHHLSPGLSSVTTPARYPR
jgi:ribosomal subunit interface protein